MAGLGKPSCSDSIGWIMALIAWRSCKSHHFHDFLAMVKIRVFQGLVEGSIWPIFNCCKTKLLACFSLSPVMGHCSTQKGVEDFQTSGRGGILTVTPNKKIEWLPSTVWVNLFQRETDTGKTKGWIWPDCPSGLMHLNVSALLRAWVPLTPVMAIRLGPFSHSSGYSGEARTETSAPVSTNPVNCFPFMVIVKRVLLDWIVWAL